MGVHVSSSRDGGAHGLFDGGVELVCVGEGAID
jgi:hypothetical protein